MHFTRRAAKEAGFEAVAFGVAAGEIALCHHRALLLSALLVVTGVLALGAFGFKRHLFVLCAIAGVLGPAAEALGVRGGAWHYTAPDFLGIPLWLPFAWGLIGILNGAIAATVADIMRP